MGYYYTKRWEGQHTKKKEKRGEEAQLCADFFFLLLLRRGYIPVMSAASGYVSSHKLALYLLGKSISLCDVDM